MQQIGYQIEMYKKGLNLYGYQAHGNARWAPFLHLDGQAGPSGGLSV